MHKMDVKAYGFVDNPPLLVDIRKVLKECETNKGTKHWDLDAIVNEI
jgi:hypothetical protein